VERSPLACARAAGFLGNDDEKKENTGPAFLGGKTIKAYDGINAGSHLGGRKGKGRRKKIRGGRQHDPGRKTSPKILLLAGSTKETSWGSRPVF